MSNPITITSQSGVLRYADIDGRLHSISHLYCTCKNATVTTQPNRYDSKNAVSVIIHCPTHGDLKSTAIACGLTFECEAITNKSVFSLVETRFRNDKRPQWGKTARGGSA